MKPLFISAFSISYFAKSTCKKLLSAITLFVITALCSSCLAQSPRQLLFSDSLIQYMGRIHYSDSAAELSWPGTTAEIHFTGKYVNAWLQDETENNRYSVVVDGAMTKTFTISNQKQSYTLAAGLQNGPHQLQLIKITEPGKTFFYGFELDEDAKAENIKNHYQHKMEFYGNSITCGYAVEDTTGKDRGSPAYENYYKTYAAITARHFNAYSNCIAKSGIGVTVSWFPLIMPEMYDRINQNDTIERWDFNQFTPELVVINLFQNDSWIVKLPDNPQFKRMFGTQPPTEDFIIQAYKNFVQTIRSKYPKARIICCLGSMDATKKGSAWPGYIKKAIAQLADKKIYNLFFAYKETPGHPSATEQQVMATTLINFIEKKIHW